MFSKNFIVFLIVATNIIFVVTGCQKKQNILPFGPEQRGEDDMVGYVLRCGQRVFLLIYHKDKNLPTQERQIKSGVYDGVGIYHVIQIINSRDLEIEYTTSSPDILKIGQKAYSLNESNVFLCDWPADGSLVVHKLGVKNIQDNNEVSAILKEVVVSRCGVGGNNPIRAESQTATQPTVKPKNENGGGERK